MDLINVSLSSIKPQSKRSMFGKNEQATITDQCFFFDFKVTPSIEGF